MRYRDLKPYSIDEFTELVFSILEETVREYPKRINVGWTGISTISEHSGKLNFVGINEHEIASKEKFTEAQEWIAIWPLENTIPYYVEGDGFRKLEDVISDLKKQKKLQITVCVLVLKQVEDGHFLVKLFDRFFIIRTNILLRFGEPIHVIFIARHDSKPRMVDVAFCRIGRKEVLMELV